MAEGNISHMSYRFSRINLLASFCLCWSWERESSQKWLLALRR